MAQPHFPTDDTEDSPLSGFAWLVVGFLVVVVAPLLLIWATRA